MPDPVPDYLAAGYRGPTPKLEVFRADYDRDDNIWWMIGGGHHQNLFEAACERIDELEQEVADLRAENAVLRGLNS